MTGLSHLPLPIGLREPAASLSVTYGVGPGPPARGRLSPSSPGPGSLASKTSTNGPSGPHPGAPHERLNPLTKALGHLFWPNQMTPHAPAGAPNDWLHTARWGAAALTALTTGVQLIVWAMICVVTQSIESPWWLWSTVPGVIVTAFLSWMLDDPRSARHRAERRPIARTAGAESTRVSQPRGDEPLQLGDVTGLELVERRPRRAAAWCARSAPRGSRSSGRRPRRPPAIRPYRYARPISVNRAPRATRGDDIGAGHDAGVEVHLGVVADLLDNLRQQVERDRRAVELAAAVVGKSDPSTPRSARRFASSTFCTPLTTSLPGHWSLIQARSS